MSACKKTEQPQEKLQHGLAYIAIIHEQICARPAYQTDIYQYLALIDFANIKAKGRLVFDLDYLALKSGPVPAMLYDNRDAYLESQPFRDVLVLEKIDDTIIFKPIAEPDLQYFSDDEIALMESIVEKYASTVTTTEQLCRISHTEIEAWKVAWKARNDKNRVRINPLDTFPNILQKSSDELTPIEEAALWTFLTSF
jgi:uncharacterized phage-associated protein